MTARKGGGSYNGTRSVCRESHEAVSMTTSYFCSFIVENCVASEIKYPSALSKDGKGRDA
jgi:hypothetical protein